jgi:hypothetical protein
MTRFVAAAETRVGKLFLAPFCILTLFRDISSSKFEASETAYFGLWVSQHSVWWERKTYGLNTKLCGNFSFGRGVTLQSVLEHIRVANVLRTVYQFSL